LKNTPARGIRILPNYHGYRLWDPCAEELLTLAREHNLIVQVFVRIVDERWQHMHFTPAVDVGQDIAYLISMFPKNKVIVSGTSIAELRSLTSALKAHPALYADISRVRGPVFALDNFAETMPLQRILLGTLWPVQIMEASVWEITTSTLSAQHQRAILYDNAAAILSPAPQEITTS